MGQGESVPQQQLVNAIEEYKKLQLAYDEVEDELHELYAEFDATKASLMNKHRKVSGLSNRFNREDRILNEMTEEDAKAFTVFIVLLE